MAAYYNEHDPFAAAWLRELIKAGQITDGEVDERSIEDLRPEDLVGVTQLHLFGGVGVWSYALREAGWPDDRPIWTASCPCPPFSSAGKKKQCPECAGSVLIPCPRRTGFFICCSCDHAWLADGRHLWPEVWRLVRDCRPDTICGEQVSSADGRVWLDLVRASLEILGYAVGVLDTSAAQHGAPHIRQRLYWCAVRTGRLVHAPSEQAGLPGRAWESGRTGGAGLLADAMPAGRSEGWAGPGLRSSASSSSTGGLADDDDDDERRNGRGISAGVAGRSEPSDDGELGHHHHQGLAQRQVEAVQSGALRIEGSAVGETGLVRGRWAGADWIFCRDGKWRPVEPGTFPLATGAPNRVGRLRGYGNALTAPVAQGFIEAVMDALGRTEP